MITLPPRLEDAHEYLDKVIESLRALDRREKQPLVAILEYLSEYIRTTRGEVAQLRSSVGGPVAIAQASDELEEIVVETARATNAIMSVAEDLEELSDHLDEPYSAAMRSSATKIYEACAFQDITGQRISKVVRAMQHIDGKLAMLAKACGMDGDIAEAAVPAEAPLTPDALLNGPQIGTSAQTQDEIDRLFNS
jgi:chemotaxis protein CheZ